MFQDFYYMTLITTLSRGGHLFHDAPGLLTKVCTHALGYTDVTV